MPVSAFEVMAVVYGVWHECVRTVILLDYIHCMHVYY